MKINIITGLSGAGKTQALKILEDFGFFCVDNLPASLIESFFRWYKKGKTKQPIALGLDIRTGRPAINEIIKRRKHLNIIFLEADVRTLINRYKTTRRKHPLGGALTSAVPKEKKLTIDIKNCANQVIDTSNLTLQELKQVLYKSLGISKKEKIAIQIISFGYRFGIPMESDIVFDVRFMRNPNYVKKLKYLTGLNVAVRRYIFAESHAKRFLGMLKKMLSFLLPRYVDEGKSYLTVAFGCTGGHHRSVAVACEIAGFIQSLGYDVRVLHRDKNKRLQE